MRNVVCCWCKGDSISFENNVPLLFVGERNLKLGFKNNIDLLFLDGYELLSERYRSMLINAGYRLHDTSRIFSDLDRKYEALNIFNSYEKKCFLRWLVLSQYFQGEKFIHYDGDIVFNESPHMLNEAMNGKTFVLQGCPALTCISDQAWFSQYKEQLLLFTADIEGYSEKAWAEREGWELSHQQKWAGSRFRKVISSDQDFISHLIHTDRIIQDRPCETLKDLVSSYIFFENPLYISGYSPYNNNLPFKYTRRSGVDYINEKRVAVWHMQSSFTRYLSKFILKKTILRRDMIGMGRLGNQVEKRGLEDYLISAFNKLFGGRSSRLDVYKYFFEENDFSEVLNDNIWWQTGVFI